MYKPYLVGLLKKLFGEPNRMNDKEKLEAIQQVLDEISSKQRNYLDDTSLLDYFERQIKKILES